MSSVIEQFLSLQTNDNQHQPKQYECIWQKIQKQIDRFDEYRIKKVLNHQIQQNEDLVKELLNLLQIWKESTQSKNDQQITHDDHNFDQRFFEIPERQLLQNQILLNLKEIKHHAATHNISMHLLLSFDKNSVEYKTLMYIIRTPHNSLKNKPKQNANHSQKRPQTSFTINPRKMVNNDMNISITDDDIIQQTRCALNDEYQILLHRIDQLRRKLDDICKDKLKLNATEIKDLFIPSTLHMQDMNDKLQEICDNFAHNNTRNNVTHKHMKNTIKLKPLKRPKVRKMTTSSRYLHRRRTHSAII